MKLTKSEIGLKLNPNQSLFSRLGSSEKPQRQEAGKSCGKLEKSEDGGVGSSQRRSVAILKRKAANVVNLH